MQVASTLQFRAATSLAFTALGLTMPSQSWTEGAGRGSDVRWVGYPMYGIPRAMKGSVASAIERLLVKNGVSARVRISKAGYLRGTCVLA